MAMTQYGAAIIIIRFAIKHRLHSLLEITILFHGCKTWVLFTPLPLLCGVFLHCISKLRSSLHITVADLRRWDAEAARSKKFCLDNQCKNPPLPSVLLSNVQSICGKTDELEAQLLTLQGYLFDDIYQNTTQNFKNFRNQLGAQRRKQRGSYIRVRIISPLCLPSQHQLYRIIEVVVVSLPYLPSQHQLYHILFKEVHVCLRSDQTWTSLVHKWDLLLFKKL